MNAASPTLRLAALTAALASVPVVTAQALPSWIAPPGETIIDTDSTTFVPLGSGPITIQNGVFLFHNVIIPAGSRVVGVGSRPMIWLATGTFTVDGELRLDGEDGQDVNTLGGANFAAPGGRGVCSGGDGGDGSPVTTDRSYTGQAGFDAFQIPGLGGVGGNLSCALTQVVPGTGGGGGRFITRAGDIDYRAATPFTQMLGIGGTANVLLAGGAPGRSPFGDLNPDNDFIGAGFDRFARRVVIGELGMIRGGQGGGGGGDRAPRCQPGDPMFVNDERGAGGGGGGGALVVLSLEFIVIGPEARISADGGDGGGGEQAGSNNRGGGGGGGSGGLVALGSTRGILLHAHGGLYANGDTSFSITADGGIGRQGRFGAMPITGKYPPESVPTLLSTQDRASGGFGGMGIVQLMVPPRNNADGTNTIFDDSILVVQNGALLTGAAKSAYLAWRGWPDATGQRVDDNGAPIAVTGDGDIRPAPILLPMF